MPSPYQNILWPVFSPEGKSIGLNTPDGMVLCLFSSKILAARWLIDMGLEKHIVGKALDPPEIAQFCDVAMADGFKFAIINPPIKLGRRVQMGTLLNLKEQAVARAQKVART